ncbi:hypothetical protein J6590_051832 [Homalodisca vitripennis]|nr:hypothetical protein J6590_051832 [Homalodisca vitripennis]
MRTVAVPLPLHSAVAVAVIDKTPEKGTISTISGFTLSPGSHTDHRRLAQNSLSRSNPQKPLSHSPQLMGGTDTVHNLPCVKTPSLGNKQLLNLSSSRHVLAVFCLKRCFRRDKRPCGNRLSQGIRSSLYLVPGVLTCKC